ncbi:GNAT family N-acetyltransferase [Actinomyces sp. MRS3W]|uniref:GNAT family N-acetyltransferase n=1 Tax=Actinomyces sp. MRS3W TaxID=2800796 RepID=UPI0028FD88AE|nr:GNAT family N-acetyltransferase [Actinomyces sp. MRS3W]MDU0347701.1 GNAT family N-acetyltransferase [Actinomyces sp. MRS3W]
MHEDAAAVIRPLREDEAHLLEDFLYEAIYVPEGVTTRPPRSIIDDDPKCRAHFEGFGTLPDDRALVAETGGRVVGACWVRTTDCYGHIDDATPAFAVSLYREFRGQGIGTRMLRRMLEELREAGYARASLGVAKGNPALHLYKRLGFRIVGDGSDDTEWLMVCELRPS